MSDYSCELQLELQYPAKLFLSMPIKMKILNQISSLLSFKFIIYELFYSLYMWCMGDWLATRLFLLVCVVQLIKATLEK